MSGAAGARRAFAIFNPVSGRGRGARRIRAYRDLLGRHFPDIQCAVTEAPGDEYRLADQALADGYDLLVAVGGDGTWSHVADRLLTLERTDVALGVLPSGTGNDFGRNLGLAYADPADAVARLASGRPVPVDVGRVNTPSHPAERGKATSDVHRVRHFINVVGTGFDVAVVDAAAGARFLKGEVLYKVTALKQLFRFPGKEFTVEDDSGFSVSRRHLMVTVTNGAFFGGGFPIAPSGQVDDGVFHACLIGDAPPLRRLRLFNLAEKGRHVGQPEVEMRTARRVRFRADGPIRFEADGDIFETDRPELDLELLPGALKVVRG